METKRTNKHINFYKRITTTNKKMEPELISDSSSDSLSFYQHECTDSRSPISLPLSLSPGSRTLKGPVSKKQQEEEKKMCWKKNKF